MRSPFRLAFVSAVALAAPLAHAQPDAPVREGAIARDEVRDAVAELRNDPNLAPQRTVRMLRWTEREATETGGSWWRHLVNALARFTRGLVGWLAESGRVIVLVAGAALVAALVAYVARIVRRRGLSARLPPGPKAPSHVRDLDIRPESLPSDVGAAALELWRRNEQRAALALLYRGLLSRLVHVHGVPVRASSTECECLELARQRLVDTSAEYAARLIGVWTAAVYGAKPARPEAVEALCAQFGASLDLPHGAPP